MLSDNFFLASKMAHTGTYGLRFSVYGFGDLSTGTTIPLSYKEAQLLRFFSEHPDETLSAENLLLNVWNVSPTEDRLHCVRSSISRLRLKLEGLAEIKAYYGEGYRFEV